MRPQWWGYHRPDRYPGARHRWPRRRTCDGRDPAARGRGAGRRRREGDRLEGLPDHGRDVGRRNRALYLRGRGYAAASPYRSDASEIPDHPLSRAMTPDLSATKKPALIAPAFCLMKAI